MLSISKCVPDEVQPKDKYYRGSRFCEIELNDDMINLDFETIVQTFKLQHVIPKCDYYPINASFTGLGTSDGTFAKVLRAAELVEYLCNDYNTPVTLIVPVSEKATPQFLNSHVNELCKTLECGELALVNCPPYDVLNSPNSFGTGPTLVKFLKVIHRPNVGMCVDIRNLKADKTELKPFFKEAADYITAVRIAGGNCRGTHTVTSRLLLREINNAIVASDFDGLVIIDVDEEDDSSAVNYTEQSQLMSDYCTFDFMW